MTRGAGEAKSGIDSFRDAPEAAMLPPLVTRNSTARPGTQPRSGKAGPTGERQPTLAGTTREAQSMKNPPIMENLDFIRLLSKP